MHFDMGKVTAEAKEVVQDFLGHWIGLWMSTTHSELCFEKLVSGCCMENGLGGGRGPKAARHIRDLGQQRCATCLVGWSAPALANYTSERPSLLPQTF